MKKFLLASVCLLALTACSQGQQGKGTTAASSKREATQTKKEQVQTKTFVSDLGDHHQNKIQIGYKNDEIVSMTIMGVAPIPEDMQKSDVAELKEVYQEELIKQIPNTVSTDKLGSTQASKSLMINRPIQTLCMLILLK